MRIAEVVGRVTLSRGHPSLHGGRFLIALPMPLGALREGLSDRGEELVVYDSLGAGPGALIGVSEGREAANPFGPVKTPVDAYCACLIDHISLEPVGSALPRGREAPEGAIPRDLNQTSERRRGVP